MKSALSLGCFALGAVLLAGCPGPKGPQLVEVEGTVTVEGKPMEGLRVEFWPESQGPTSAGKTDANGHFVLETVEQEPKKGAVEGMHKIAIRDTTIVKQFVGRSEESITEGRLPRTSAKYVNALMSGLTQSISGPQKDIKLDIEPYSQEEMDEMAKEGQK